MNSSRLSMAWRYPEEPVIIVDAGWNLRELCSTSRKSQHCGTQCKDVGEMNIWYRNALLMCSEKLWEIWGPCSVMVQLNQRILENYGKRLAGPFGLWFCQFFARATFLFAWLVLILVSSLRDSPFFKLCCSISCTCIYLIFIFIHSVHYDSEGSTHTVSH